MTDQQTETEQVCICPLDYCLDDSADPDGCPVCAGLDPYDPCPNEVEDGVFSDPLIHHLLSNPPDQRSDR